MWRPGRGRGIRPRTSTPREGRLNGWWEVADDGGVAAAVKVVAVATKVVAGAAAKVVAAAAKVLALAAPRSWLWLWRPRLWP